jgi:hypothetical protein
MAGLERVHCDWKRMPSSHRHGRTSPGHDGRGPAGHGGEDTIPVTVKTL